MSNFRRKEENRFKFIPFSERISNINVDIFHRVAHRNEESEAGTTTYLQEAAEKWIVLNRTHEWLEFHKLILGCGITTLPQLLNRKDAIAELFRIHIPLQTEHSLQPVLELLTAFVKDLRQEFYPYYPVILQQLIQQLKSRNPEIIEQSFICLAFIFKYITRNLVKNLDIVLADLAPLLDDNQPEYIRNFAAESFAFVARRVKDKAQLLTLVLATVQQHPELLEGCARLVMETMYGIKGQPHSSSLDMLMTMFSGFGNSQLAQNLLFSFTRHVVSSYLLRINPKHSNVVFALVELFKQKSANCSATTALKEFHPLLKLLLMILGYRGGIHIRDVKPLYEMILALGFPPSFPVSILSLLAELVVTMLGAENVKLPQEYAIRLTSMVLQQPKKILLEFVEAACEYGGFEAVVLPSLLDRCTEYDKDVIKTLSKVLIKKISKTKWILYTLQCKTSCIPEAILFTLSKADLETDIEEISHCLLLLPHITPLDQQRAVDTLVELAIRTTKFRKSHSVFLLYLTLESLSHLNGINFGLLNSKEVYDYVMPIVKESFLAFKCLELLLELTSREGVSKENIEEMRRVAVDYLISRYHKARESALNVLKNLCVEDGVLDKVLSTCLAAETVELNVQTYRDATVHIRELFCERINLDENLIEVPFRFLLGYLHTNFSLVEADVTQAIQSYDQVKCNQIWQVLKDSLIGNKQEYGNDIKSLVLPDYLKEWITTQAGCDDRFDQNSYQDKLWKVLQNFSLQDEQEKDLIDLTLVYANCHCYQYLEHTCDIRQKTDLNASSVVPAEPEVPAEVEKVKLSKRMLGCQLEVISKTRAHCSSKYKMMDTKKLCMDLLLDGDSNLRKSALECLVAQGGKSLSQYRKHLLDLINDDGFKSAVVYFQLDTDGGEVKEGHRVVVMPIVLRLLYSKMVSSSPTQRGNKSSAAAHRRKQVMRFLSACQEKEMQHFLTMAFSIFNIDQSDKMSSRVIAESMEKVTLDGVVHPRKLQSAVNLVGVMLEYLGGRLSERLQKFLLQVLMSVAATVSGILSHRQDILSGFLPLLKKLRNTCLVTLTAFLDKFHNFPWTEEDIECLFNVVVWPVAEKLSMEGIHSPTPLLKLFSVCSQHPRYFQLLAKHMEGNDTKTPLAFMMDLLLNGQCHQTVTASITTILENLLTLQDEVAMETEEALPPVLEIHNVRPIDVDLLSKLSVKDDLNYGSKLLLPHVGEILEYLRRQLAHSDKRGLGRTETIVLARVTELATSPEHGDVLIGLQLRVLAVKPPTDEEILVNSLVTIKNLLSIVSRPLTYLRSFACLFGNIEPVQARKVLITCVEELGSRCPEASDIATIVRDLNAYDRRWIDQCDFNKRLDTLKLVRTLSANDKLTMDVAAFVVHTAFFFLKTEKDLSIRDNTELCLKEICPKLLRAAQNIIGDREYLSEILLKTIMAGIQGKDDCFKSSVISLLGVLARECPSSHYVLNDLSIFTNASDLEVDVFENINHLQLYRRNRALLKLASVLRSLRHPISIRCVTNFLMPLANQFLCNESYAGKNSLVDAAIECVGTLCRLLPWYHYQSLLKHYLLKLRTQIVYQRQCVRLVIAILDAFHFDISNAAKVNSQVSQEVKTTQDVVMREEYECEKDNENTAVMDVLEDILDAVVAENPEESSKPDEENDIMEINEDILVVEKITVLKPTAAMRVQRAISGPLLDQLYKAIGQRTAVDSSHKLNRKALGPDKDEQDILRVPIAVTLVKLLQRLPGDMLEVQLPGIFMKLCTFLKSHLESVRRVTRETLQQIMASLGPGKLALLLDQLTGLLTKGFQIHVLVFTIHTVVQGLQPLLQPGDVDTVLPTILQVCSTDLFGQASEEKEVVRMQVKHKEVRSNKSFNLLHLVSQFITEKCLTDLILPIKQVLSQKSSHKMLVKCRECLRQIVLGLALNKFIGTESLLVFLYGAASESIPQLQPPPPPVPKKQNPKERKDCFLLAPEPKSRALSGAVKNSARSGAHVIVEFGLHLLMLLLKHEKLKKAEYRPLLDPFIPVLKSALDSQHIQVTTLAIKCLTRMVKYDLPSLREHLKSITASLFASLHKFAAAGLNKGDNFDLVLAAFKMVSVIVRDAEYHTLTQEQLRALLLYAEQDIHDSSRQAVAFSLIKSVLHRKLNAPELHAVVEKVAALSVTSEMEHVRTQARQTMLHYMMDYPLGSKLEELLAFFTAQLSYEVESGRQSALEMIFSLISSFPVKFLKEQSGFFFLTLGARLVNDDSPDCKKMIVAVIKEMLLKLTSTDRDELFEMILVWLKQKKLMHRRLAVQLAGIFVALEKEDFAPRLGRLLPLIQKQFVGDRKPGQFVREAVEKAEEQTLLDHHLYLTMVLLVKLSVHCPLILSNDEYRESVSVIADTAQNLLCHEHEWVRVGAAQFLGAIFSSIKPSSLVAALNGVPEADVKFWDANTFTGKLRSLILDHTAQFVPGVEMTQEFINQLMKNLVYFARVLKDVKESATTQGKDERTKEEENAETRTQTPTLTWLVRRMRRIVNLEVARTPTCQTMRSAVFMWTGAVTVCLTKDELLPVLYHLAAPLVREAEVAQGETSVNKLAALAADVMTKLKKKVGVDVFAEHAVKLQRRLMERRAKRKSAKAQEFVTDPEKAVKRKMERQVKKKESKKRRKEIVRGKKPGKFKGKKKKT